MKEFKHIIKDPLGIHARPASLLVKEAGKFTSDISIETGGKIADAKKIFAVMGLGAKVGSELVVQCTGEDEETASAELENFFKANL